MHENECSYCPEIYVIYHMWYITRISGHSLAFSALVASNSPGLKPYCIGRAKILHLAKLEAEYALLRQKVMALTSSKWMVKWLAARERVLAGQPLHLGCGWLLLRSHTLQLSDVEVMGSVGSRPGNLLAHKAWCTQGRLGQLRLGVCWVRKLGELCRALHVEMVSCVGPRPCNAPG